MILGLDIATITGWCQFDGYLFETGEWSFKPEKDEPEGVRYHRMWATLSAHLDGTPPDAVVIEEPYTMSKRGAHVLGGLIAAAEIALEERGLPYVFVNANTLKAWARKQGIQKKPSLKEGMRLEAMHLLGRDLTDNEADAYWLVQWLLENNEA